AALDALERVLEHLAAAERFALPRRVDAQPAVERPRVEVRVRFDRADAHDHPVDPHLALDGTPEEQEARAARRLHLARLPAPVVRVEDEAALVHALEEHGADRWAAVRRGGGERHRGRIRFELPHLVEPAGELPQGVGLAVGLAQRLPEVLAPDIGQGHLVVSRWSVVGGRWSFVVVATTFTSSPSTTIRAAPPSASDPNSIASESGFFTLRSMSRAIGRAPNARSKPEAASHARASGSSSMVTPLADTIARSSSICLSTTRSICAGPSALKWPMASRRLRNSGVNIFSSAPREETPVPASAKPRRRSERSRAPALVVMMRMTWRKSALRP